MKAVRQKIVVVGMMSNQPFAGPAWMTMSYLVGLERLGFDVYYVETHGVWPSNFSADERDDGSAGAAAHLDRVMKRFGLGAKWAFHARHSDGAWYGMSEAQALDALRSATLVLNLHAGTLPYPELAETGRFVCLETDPVALQIEVFDGIGDTIEFLEGHCAYFSFGANQGNPDCRVPSSDRFTFRPTRPPVLLDLWQLRDVKPGTAFTTIGNWAQYERDIEFAGETYYWSKHHEFYKFIDLPTRTDQEFELAISSCDDIARQRLVDHNWRVRAGLSVSKDLETYRRYIHGSRGEFTVAKDQNVRLRSGWFSERSAAYLAAGRPVITQETGFSNALPTGEGLFGFSTMDEILGAVEAIRGDYERHSRAAREIAREYFDAPVVLTKLLVDLGVAVPRAGRRRRASEAPFPRTLVIEPASRRPLRLPLETCAAVLGKPRPAPPRPRASEPIEPRTSIVVVTLNNLIFNRLCIESVLAHTPPDAYELIVVDNGSQDGTLDYLAVVSEVAPQVRVVANGRNAGFAVATNIGLSHARGERLVLLNNDTAVAPGWLDALEAHLEDPTVGLVGPVTNRIGTEAEIPTGYRTYGQMLAFAAERLERMVAAVETRVVPMFCLAMRRDVYEKLGPLDSRYEVGFFEDDDYSRRAQEAGYRTICATEVFVHHFGEATFGRLFRGGDRDALFKANRRRFEAKWRAPWDPHRTTTAAEYAVQRERIRRVIEEQLPREATVVVVSRGDPSLVSLGGRRAWHFPSGKRGSYAGYYPADSAEAIAHLEVLRARGAGYFVLPDVLAWWFDYYRDFGVHVRETYASLPTNGEPCRIFALAPGDGVP